MRALLIASAALVATPAMAQDHGDHSQHTPAPTPAPAPEQAPAQTEDHSQHGAMDRGAMDHSTMDHSAMDHSQMDHGQMDHSQMDHSAMDHGMEMVIPSGPPPARAFEGPEHAADLFFDPQDMAAARAYNHASHGGTSTGTVLVERLEAQLADGHDTYVWDVSAWYGTGTDKIVFKSEGEGEFGGSVEEAEAQLLWGHAVGPWVDLQVGMRVDAEPDTTAHAVVGLAGLAPYNVHFDLAAFVSDEGDLTARIEAEHDMRLSQRLILQPRVEAEIAAQDIPERDITAGFYHVTVGARLRYEIAREFAPYIGVEYATGDEPDRVALLLGLRTWF
ncbi:copper resistance protein B [Aurantiacibacter gilvus]|uniref:Copper resistance protein B n=1 Tax=Aurantiacibacter gilvus TaxID=3139141 RepID=A0ABU9IIS8_9SPHN